MQSAPDYSLSKNNYSLQRDKFFWLILIGGALVRILFLVVGAKAYYGAEHVFTNGDTNSYTLSFVNLLQHGSYTFDFQEPEASFGRLPGYPFFYGIHYLIFGQAHAFQATACTQTLLDCVSIALVFLIARKLVPAETRFTPYIAATLYAFYPFIIVWITIIGTEQFATFLTLVWLYTLLLANRNWVYYLLLGIELSLLFYVREFLGILFPITCLYLLFSRGDNWGVALRNCTLVGVAFMALYIWWPARNYVYQHRIMLVKPERAGFANYKTDMVSFLNWVHSWSNQSSYWLQQALSNPQPAFPDDIFASPQEKAQALALIKQANDCGSSFYIYKNGSRRDDIPNNTDYTIECNEEIHQGFEQLRQSFKSRHPFVYYTRVPLQNVYKVFFKSGTEGGDGNIKRQLLLGVVFGYRTLLLIIGVIGMLLYRRIPGVQPILFYWVFIVVFLCFYFRQLEMRYLIQADVLLLFPAAMLLGQVAVKWLSSKQLAR